MAEPKWINVNPSDELEDRAKFRLAFRDVVAWGDLLWSFAPPMSLTEKAQKFFDSLAGGPIAYPASQPTIGEAGTVFVIDVRAKTDAPFMPIRNAMATIEETVPGLELVSVELVVNEGSDEAASGRETTFRAAADVDAIRDAELNPFAGPANAVQQAAAGVGTVAVLVGVIVVVMLAKSYRR